MKNVPVTTNELQFYDVDYYELEQQINSSPSRAFKIQTIIIISFL